MRRTGYDVLAVAVITVAVSLVSLATPRLFSVVGAAERWLNDLRSVLFALPEPQHGQIIIVTIDEASLAQFPYRSPVDRGLLAAVIDRLATAGARAIALDVLLDQPTEKAKDAALRQSLSNATVAVIVAWADASDGLTPRQTTFLDAFTVGLRRATVTQIADPLDGAVRWIDPGRDTPQGSIPGLPQAVLKALGMDVPERVMPLAYRAAPADGETPAFRSFPAHLVPSLPLPWFKDKIVLIGSDLPHIDRHRTPLMAARGAEKGELPGVVIHAHALAQLLDGRQAHEVSITSEVMTVVIGTLFGCAVTLPRISPPVQWLSLVSGFSLFWVLAFAVVRFGLPPLPLIAPSVAVVLGFASGGAYWGARARRDERFIREAFSRFTAPSVVDALVADPTRLRLSAEKRELSCLFSDLAGFTPLVEQGDPERVMPLLNAYLDGLCEIVFQHGGTIMKIVGDATHVMFNAPLHQPDHARRAILCGLHMAEFGREFSARHATADLPFGITRIGIHSGAALVGNFGGERFFDYTAYGDTINIAARLEGANKYLGTLVCVSGATVALAGTDLPVRPVGTLLMQGKTTGVDAYEPLGSDGPDLALFEEYLAAYALMRDDNPAARNAFAKLSAHWPKDALSRFHAHRLSAGEKGLLIRLKGK